MSTVGIELLGEGACRIVHEDTGAELRSSMSPQYGGKGDGFSSTDLVAAALGSCIATNLEPVAVRHGVPLGGIRIRVEKTLGVSPKRIQSLVVLVDVGAHPTEAVTERLRRAASHCVVHRALAPEVEVTIEFGH